MTKTKLQSRNSYNRISRWYDLLKGHWEEGAANQGHKMLGVRDGQRILEIGPGPGKALRALARLTGESGRVYCLDIPDRMLTLASRRPYEATLMEKSRICSG